MEKSEFTVKLGSFIKKKREDRNWSQAELAAQMGNNYQNISSIERGEVTPTMYWVFRLSIVFELSYSQFITEFEKEYLQKQSIN